VKRDLGSIDRHAVGGANSPPASFAGETDTRRISADPTEEAQ